jgi:hypothetical protein
MSELAKLSEVREIIHKIEEEDFERFDCIYEDVMKGDLYFQLEDIAGLFKIFNAEFMDIHPQQYVKVHRMTYKTIERYGFSIGFEEFIKGLYEIIDRAEEQVEDYLNMLLSYDIQVISLFSEQLHKCDSKFQDKVKEILEELECDLPAKYKDKIAIIK